MLNGEFSCVKGHKFEEAQIVTTAIADTADPPADAPAEAPAAPPAQAAPTPPAEPEEDFQPPPHLRVPGDKVLTASAPRPNLDPVVEQAGVAAPKFNPPPNGAMVPTVIGRVPGNNMKVELVIPELHWVGISAEAEVQHQSPEVYLQEMVGRALDNRWIY
jgi:hypothetical protein